jgi:hypothetical protein
MTCLASQILSLTSAICSLSDEIIRSLTPVLAAVLIGAASCSVGAQQLQQIVPDNAPNCQSVSGSYHGPCAETG